MEIPEESGSNYENAPVGTHAARCVSFIDLGSHQESYEGVPKQGLTHRVRLGFELPLELMSDGRPFTISKRYTWSMSEKATLRKHLESWRGVPFAKEDFGKFDIKNVIGKECSVSIKAWERDGKSGTSLDHIGKAMKGLNFPPQANESIYFSLKKGRFDLEVFHALPEKIKEFIQKSSEWSAMTGGNDYAQQSGGVMPDGREVAPDGFGDTEIPF